MNALMLSTVSAALLLSACSQDPPVPDRNPNPTRPVAAALAPVGVDIQSVHADASYQTLAWCMKPDPWRGGSIPIGQEQIDIPLRDARTGFATVAYADYFKPKPMNPEMSPCVWSLIAIRFYFTAGGRDYSAMVAHRDGQIQPGTLRLRCFPDRPPLGTIPDLCMSPTVPTRSNERFFEVQLAALPAPPS